MKLIIPEDLLFTKDHEWARVEEEIVTAGISDFAQQQLGDIVYLELPEEGEEVKQGEPMGVVESTKGAHDIYAPVSGTIVEVNTALIDSPEIINDDSYDDGWLVRIEISDKKELKNLLTPEEYKDFCEQEEH